MIELEGFDQGSQEWLQARCGVVTASRFKEIVTTKGVPSKSRTGYMRDLAGEIISGEPKITKELWQFKKGHAREPEARKYYSMYHAQQEVRQVPFVFLDNHKRIGCSPDGMVDPSGGFENKNAEPRTQIDRYEDGLPGRWHYQQVQGCIWICEREWWDIQSYSRNMKSIVVRYTRDNEFIGKMKAEIHRFIKELDELVKKHS